MPILDPILQFKLSSIVNDKPKCDIKLFYLKYLQIASKLIYQNFKTNLALLQFQKDYEKFKMIISNYFKVTFDANKLIPNIYYALLDTINQTIPNEIDSMGRYYIYTYFKNNFFFFNIDISNSYHSWFLSDNPIAVLCLHLNALTDSDLNTLIFEIDLMASAGMTIVLCINNFSKSQFKKFELLIQILYEHPISEIHVTFDSIVYDPVFDKFVDELLYSYRQFNSYFYFYIRYFETDKNQQELNLLKKKLTELKKMPRFILTCFSESIKESFIKCDFEQLQGKFKICTDCSMNDKIKVILNDVPLYESNDDENDQKFFSCEFSHHNQNNRYCGYISSDDFLFIENTKVQITFDVTKSKLSKTKSKRTIGRTVSAYFNGHANDDDTNKTIVKYVNYDDIHYINQELYVKNQISLAKIDTNLKLKCQMIINKLECNNVSNAFLYDKRKSSICPDEILSSAIFEYKKFYDEGNIKKFEFHLNQIYAMYEIINSCVKITQENQSGFIYQIPTGEGKSAMIFILAAALAQMKKTVHIVTSNVVLANRDYNSSFDYFNKLKLCSAALLHENEMPDFLNDQNINHYPEKFFGKELFNNSMKMNFRACDKSNKAQIIFSTITNFECYYLYKTEKENASIDDYYSNAVLLIDEADSILIDEITNGTIISKQMRSNSKKVLKYFYDEYSNNDKITSKQMLGKLKEKFSECTDLNDADVFMMFNDIELVKNERFHFVENRKYLIVDSKDSNQKSSKKIVPFDYNMKGIIDQNKEYSGFIEQFIAIKENERKKQSEDEIYFKDISLNYLYISHPIYIKLYNFVFGLTGTIGDTEDKKLLRKHYNLIPKSIPRQFPNRCYHFPITLCKSSDERNNYIVKEIMEFHKSGYPVLAIFYSPDEIEIIQKIIEERDDFDTKKEKIRIYNGQDIKFKLNNDVGKKGTISLGTNVCGRGTHINVDDNHLHVIISFYSTNKRTIEQAYGRTARKDKFGSVHIICQQEDFYNGSNYLDENDLDLNLAKFKIYKDLQLQYIQEFYKKKNWIFHPNLNYTRKLSKDEITNLRIPKINVSRKTACEYEYPICMNYNTYLDIQSQRIFSLFNCPNCKFTWQLFQQYIREMILESWSLLIDKSEKFFFYESYNDIHTIKEHLIAQKSNLISCIKEYLPDHITDIFDTFYHIFNKVYLKYNKDVFSIFDPDYLPDEKHEFISNNMNAIKISRISIEFRPFSIIYKSSSRIRELLDKNAEINYIQDPELKYKKKKSQKSISITVVLDNIFEKICNIFNDFLEDHINFKLFLRRTLGGCEFGICYDFGQENDVLNLQNCLFDKNPLFVICTYVNSTIPFLAGILMIMVLYLISTIKKLITIIQNLIKGILIDGWHVLKSLINFFGHQALNKLENETCEKICEFLKNNIDDQIRKFESLKIDKKYYYVIKMLSEILIDQTNDKVGDFTDKISEKILDGKNLFKIKKDAEPLMEKSISSLFKIGFLAVLYFATLFLNVHFNFKVKKQISYEKKIEKDSSIFQKNHSNKKIDEYIENEKGKLNIEQDVSLALSSMINEILKHDE